jgi:hypothetical protein
MFRPIPAWQSNWPGLARPIDGTPFVWEDIDTIVKHYLTSPGFVTTDRYPPEVLPPKGEIGYWAIFDGVKIYPVARVIVREPIKWPEEPEYRAETQVD